MLIISPTKVQARKVAGALKKKGFQGVEFIERADKTPSLLDGLKVLLENGSSNLGWRIVAGELLKDKKDDLNHSWRRTIETMHRQSKRLFRERTRNLRRRC